MMFEKIITTRTVFENMIASLKRRNKMYAKRMKHTIATSNLFAAFLSSTNEAVSINFMRDFTMDVCLSKLLQGKLLPKRLTAKIVF